MTPAEQRAHPLVRAILRGWTNRLVPEGLTLSDFEHELERSGHAVPQDLKAQLDQLEAAGEVASVPRTSQPVWRLRGWPQPLLDELDHCKEAHETLVDSLERQMSSGDTDTRIALQRRRVEATLFAIEELESCLAGGLARRRAFLQRRAQFERERAKDVVQLDADVARVAQLVRQLRVNFDRRMERAALSEQVEIARQRDEALAQANLRVDWGRPELAVAQLETELERSLLP